MINDMYLLYMKHNCVKSHKKVVRYNLLNLVTLLMTQSLEG